MAIPIHDTITRVVRDEWPRLMATLYRDLGDLGAAEDAAQEAAEIALTRWLDDGIPDRPGAWITTVARRRAVDKIRRERTGRDKSELLARLEGPDLLEAPDPTADLDDRSALQDEQLRLFFGCCHPALNAEAQVALTLRSLGGLTTTEIANAFLVPEPTMAQRLVRAKRKIAQATIPFRIPDDAELLGRVGLVHQILYLIFNEGAYASGGRGPRLDLAAEATRLARVLAQLMPDDAESQGLLALFLLIDSRRDARVDDVGDLVLLEDQNRDLWDQDQIVEACALTERALRLGRPGPFQIEAAINACHAEAPTADETDWSQIVMLYDALLRHRPTPVVELNRAVAIGMAEGPDAGLAALERPGLAAALDGYHYFHAAVAELRTRADSTDDRSAARSSLDRALELVTNDAERRLLQDRRESLG